MLAKIYRPSKTAMQSGWGKTDEWVLEYEPAERRRIEPLMGYTSSRDMKSQVRITFQTRQDAERYAKRHDIAYMVVKPKERKRKVIAYSDNFKSNRSMPWTH